MFILWNNSVLKKSSSQLYALEITKQVLVLIVISTYSVNTNIFHFYLSVFKIDGKVCVYSFTKWLFCLFAEGSLVLGGLLQLHEGHWFDNTADHQRPNLSICCSYLRGLEQSTCCGTYICYCCVSFEQFSSIFKPCSVLTSLQTPSHHSYVICTAVCSNKLNLLFVFLEVFLWQSCRRSHCHRGFNVPPAPCKSRLLSQSDSRCSLSFWSAALRQPACVSSSALGGCFFCGEK